MKFKQLIFSSLTAIAACSLLSCDGSPSEILSQGDIFKSPTLRTLALEQLELRDTLRYTTTAGERDPITGAFYEVIPDGADVEVAADSSITIRDVNLTYAKVGEHVFTFTGQVPTRASFEEALRLALGSPSALNSRLREILLQPTRSRADLIEIIQILRVQDVELGILPDENSIVGLDIVVYSHQINSINRNLINGDIFGLFNSEQRFFRVKFRFPTTEQLAAIRLITPSHNIPFADSVDFFSIQPFQAGVFNLTLFNRPVDEVNPDDFGQ